MEPLKPFQLLCVWRPSAADGMPCLPFRLATLDQLVLGLQIERKACKGSLAQINP